MAHPHFSEGVQSEEAGHCCLAGSQETGGLDPPPLTGEGTLSLGSDPEPQRAVGLMGSRAESLWRQRSVWGERCAGGTVPLCCITIGGEGRWDVERQEPPPATPWKTCV